MKPLLVPFPSKSNAAVIVVHGGGYVYRAAHEATPVCEWLQSQGITCFELQYRLAPEWKWDAQLQDLQSAIIQVRSWASRYNYSPEKVFVMGFSAGGHLTAMSSISLDPECRPNGQICIYPVIDFVSTWQTCQSVLADCSPYILQTLSPHLLCHPDTPPAFICHAKDDGIVGVHNSRLYVEALESMAVDVLYRELPSGGHGFGLDPRWTTAALTWIKAKSD